MNYRRMIILFLWLFAAFSGCASAQSIHYTTANAHSHNDYEHSLPFYDAYARHFGSIEADVWAIHGTLYVAHNRNQVAAGRTLRNLYLDPLIHRLKVNKGKAYSNGQPLQLLIDFKSSYSDVMPILTKEFRPFRKYFDVAHNPNAVRIVISGSMPPPDSLHFFDPIFTFDGRLGNRYPAKDLRRVTLVSANVQKLVRWKGEETLNASQQHILRQVIDSVHQQHKLIRFWATPNTDQAYRTLMHLGVDYIGADSLAKLEFLLRGEGVLRIGDTTSLRLNQIQVVGTHNSYKVAIDTALMSIIRKMNPAAALSLSYAHLPITEQLDKGARNLELDVYYDPKGGRFADPYGLELLKKKGLPYKPFDPSHKLMEPGLKIFHVSGIDFRSHHLLFRDQLRELRAWSKEHPNHVPVFITMNTKDGHIDINHVTQPLPFTETALDSIDMELKKYLGKDQIIIPDMVRQKGKTLRESVMENGWPALDSVRGRFLFILDQHGEKMQRYIKHHPSLKGRMMFVDAPESYPEAATMIINNPIRDQARIQKMVREGFIVRTRADANTREAREDNYTRWKAAKKSGAQIITTDYIVPSLTFSSPYHVGLGVIYREDPLFVLKRRDTH